MTRSGGWAEQFSKFSISTNPPSMAKKNKKSSSSNKKSQSSSSRASSSSSSSSPSKSQSRSSMSDVVSHIVLFILSWTLLYLGAPWFSMTPKRQILGGLLGSYLFVWLLAVVAHAENSIRKHPGWFEGTLLLRLTRFSHVLCISVFDYCRLHNSSCCWNFFHDGFSWSICRTQKGFKLINILDQQQFFYCAHIKQHINGAIYLLTCLFRIFFRIFSVPFCIKIHCNTFPPDFYF